jgi:hypothetical protein
MLGIGLYFGFFILKDTQIFQVIGITVQTPNQMLLFFLSIVLSSLFLFTGSFFRLHARSSKFFFLLSFLFSLAATAVQFYYLYIWGFFWFGRVFFGNQPFVYTKWFEVLSILVLAIALLNTMISGNALFRNNIAVTKSETVCEKRERV